MDQLWSIYSWVKALHVIAVISWMAGLLYLPRLFVHHVERAPVGSELAEVFKMMEGKLLRIIMNPAMIVAWICGLLMVLTPGAIDFAGDGWFHVKLALVLLLTGFHMWLAKWRRRLAADGERPTGRFFRIANEVPTVLMILIVVMVIVKPF